MSYDSRSNDFLKKVRKGREIGNQESNLYMPWLKAVHFGINVVSEMLNTGLGSGQTFLSRINREYDVRRDIETINRDIKFKAENCKAGLESELGGDTNIDVIIDNEGSMIFVEYKI